MEILNKKEGLEKIKKFNFKPCAEYKEDEEHLYYEGGINGFLIYNKFLDNFISYESKSSFKKVLSKINETEEINLNFSNFEENIPTSLEKLSLLLKINISLNDKLIDLKKVDLKISEEDKELKYFSSFFMDFFSYYYVVLKNELNYNNFEIRIKDDQDISGFFIFSNDKKIKKEIFIDFYKIFFDPDTHSSIFSCGKQIVYPFVISTGVSSSHENE